MTVKTLDISEARKQFSTLDEQLREDLIIKITRHNKGAFAVVDLDYLEMLMETVEILSDPEAMEMLNKSIEDIQAGRVRDHEDVKRELLGQ